MVDRSRQAVEEAFQRGWVVRIEGGGALRADVLRCLLEPLGISAREDDVCAFRAGASSGFEADPGAAADQDDGLAEQLRLVADGGTRRCGGHGAQRCLAARPFAPGDTRVTSLVPGHDQ